MAKKKYKPGKLILNNLIWAAVFVAALIVGASFLLRYLTDHGNTLEVPDFSGMTAEQAAREARFAEIRTEVTDSIYVRGVPRGSVVKQNPKAGSPVKKGRRILLTINAKQAKQTPMPRLTGYSLRSAKAEIESRGLELGRLLYVSDMATNNVLRQLYRNSEIAPGTLVPAGARIDLVLGRNPSEGEAAMPSVIGLKAKQARDVLLENGFNVDRIVYDRNIRTRTDSLDAKVYAQDPEEEEPTFLGAGASIYLTLDDGKFLE